MKAQLESPELTKRGIDITSENEEETRILKDIWKRDGKPVVLLRNLDGTVTLTIAPVVEEEPERKDPR